MYCCFNVIRLTSYIYIYIYIYIYVYSICHLSNMSFVTCHLFNLSPMLFVTYVMSVCVCVTGAGGDQCAVGEP